MVIARIICIVGILFLSTRGETWYGIYIGGSKLGYLVIRSGDKMVSERMSMRMKAMGQKREVSTFLDWVPRPDGSVSEFKFRMQSEGVEMSVEGKVTDSTLLLNISMPHSSVERKMKLKEGRLYVGSSIIPVLREVVKGRADKTVQFFDPSVLTLDELRLSYAGKSDEFFKVLRSFRGVESVVYLDDKMRVAKEEGPMGIMFLREEAESAKEFSAEDVDIILSSALLPSGKKIKDQSNLKAIFFEVEGVESIVQSPRQRIKKGEKIGVEVSVESGDSLKPSSFGKKLEEFLRPALLIQSDDAKIKSLAKSIVKGEKDRFLQVKMLVNWVHKNLKKEASFGMPSALDVLASGGGDCNEHTILFVALARAVGIPAKVIFGVAHESGYFFYHAWAEVYIGGWVQVDPTWGQVPADVARIKLGEGGPDKWINILEYVGRMKIKVVKYE
jgi:hypothetical protein